MTSNMEAYVLFPAWYFFNEDYLGFWVLTKALCIFAAYAFKSYFLLFFLSYGSRGIWSFWGWRFLFSQTDAREKKFFNFWRWMNFYSRRLFSSLSEKSHLLVSSCKSLCTVKVLFNLRKWVARFLPFCWKFIHWERSSTGIYLMKNNFGIFIESGFLSSFLTKSITSFST